MVHGNDETEFNERVRRMIRGWQLLNKKNHQWMADFLSTSRFVVTKTQYQSYVRPSDPRAFPPFLIWRFCAETKIALDGVPFEGDKPQEPVSAPAPPIERRGHVAGAQGKRRSDRVLKPAKEQPKNKKSLLD